MQVCFAWSNNDCWVKKPIVELFLIINKLILDIYNV